MNDQLDASVVIRALREQLSEAHWQIATLTARLYSSKGGGNGDSLAERDD